MVVCSDTPILLVRAFRSCSSMERAQTMPCSNPSAMSSGRPDFALCSSTCADMESRDLIRPRLVRQAPNGYRALGVLDSTWNTGPLSWIERSSLRLAAPLLRLIPARSLPGVMADASAVTEPARAYLRRAFAAISKAEFLKIWRVTTEFVEPDSDYRTQLPLLLMRGAKDRTGNIATSMPQWAIADGVAEVVIPDAGHVVTLDAPEPVNFALLAFLRNLT